MKKFFSTYWKKSISIFLALFFLSFLQGCMYYYKVQTVKQVTSKEMKDYYRTNKYFIFCQGDSTWHLSYPSITEDKISGTLEVLPAIYKKFINHDQRKGRYRNTKKHDETYVIGQVYLYCLDSVSPRFNAGDSVRIHFSAIARVENYQKAKGRTSASWVVPGIAASIFGLPVFIIVLAAISGFSGMSGLGS